MGDVFECDRCKKIVSGRKHVYELERYWNAFRRIPGQLHRTSELELCNQCREEVDSYKGKLVNEFDNEWIRFVEFALNKPEEPKKKWYQRRK